MTDVNFLKLHRVHKLALKYGITYALYYAESDNTWYFILISAAPTENWIGKNRSSLERAIQDAVERLESYA